jgi:hypothetical protein
MSAFVALPPAADADPPAQVADGVVAGDGWWPDVDLAALRDTARIDTTVTPAKLREAVVMAMLDLDRQLACWRAPLEAAGAANLAAVAQPVFAGQKRLVLLYTRAVVAAVVADLAERTRDSTATSAGLDRAEELLTVADDCRRNARWAVSDLMGRRRATAELI